VNAWLPWAFLAPLPGLLATACGRGHRPGLASLPGPLLVFAAGMLWLCGAQQPLTVRIEGWLPWLGDGAFALYLDGLAALMLAVIGAVAPCVYVYSLGYMHGDPGRRRFFVLLDVFIVSMVMLVLAGNLVVLLVGWTAVGISSYLLIAFWRERAGTIAAGMQALAANAIGDAALLLAIALLPAGAGDLATLHTAPFSNAAGGVPGGAATIAALLLVAAAAKSAQGPLYFWLPSAMAGPTPVSALIHAATMVAAGVYLLCRTSALFALAPAVMAFAAWLGVLTALAAAVGSLQQTNYKRGLAYSTLSQLGIMFAAAGVGAPFAAFFHLFTHASFKALLFLVAGIVIHSAGGEERLERLGGLRRALPGAAVLAFIGSMALIGLPVVTAGAFSKDLVLEAALAQQPLIGWLLLGGVLLTGLYTGRLWFAVFLRGDASRHVHAPGPTMLVPVAVLAIGAIGLGWLGPALARVLAVGAAPEFHAWSGLGALAGGLGLLGFVAAGWWVRARGSGAVLPPFGLPWVAGAADAFTRSSRAIAGVQDGRLVGYVFLCVVGTAAAVTASVLLP